ncbi:hypothetical protein EDD11_009679 [Mortierella claussenii]|nr:hypothetical protein EDD11_009679 [Mortierella claussenii]
MGAAVTAIAVSTRMVDLYYVQPWTGIPSRYSLKTGTGPAALAPKDAVARVKKDLHDTRSSNSNSSSNKSILADEKDTFLNWDMKRFRLEMWSPLRRFSYNTHASSSSSSSDSARLLRWQDLVPIFIVYHLILDVDIFYMSQFRSKDMEAMNIQQYSVCIAAAASFIIFQILSFYVTMAVIYGYSTGRQIDTSEWTMLESKLPCFAITPADFWINWQTLFRYLWVDLAFLPVQRYCKQYWGPDRVGDLTAKVMRQALPVMSVFALSGILHAYIVYAVWREPVWSQLLYFMLQGIAVVVTKAIERSFIGAMKCGSI